MRAIFLGLRHIAPVSPYPTKMSCHTVSTNRSTGLCLSDSRAVGIHSLDGARCLPRQGLQTNMKAGDEGSGYLRRLLRLLIEQEPLPFG